VFLADINNARALKNATYKSNLETLNAFVMVKFLQDTMVQPIESEWFGFYISGQDKLIVPLQQSALYLEDWLGLKTLDAAGRLAFLAVNADHLRFSDAWFIQNIVQPYLT